MENKDKNNDEQERVKEVITPDQPLPKSGDPDVPTTPDPEKSAVRCGYYVGVTEDGVLRFDTIGTQQSLTELLGLQHFAAEKIQSLVDLQHRGKFTYLANQMSQLDGKVSQLLKIMSQLEAVVETKGESDNGDTEGS